MLRRLGQGVIDTVDFSSNELTDVGVDSLVDFITTNQLQLRKLKLHRNRLTSLAGISRLFDDPKCGLRSQVAVKEIHLSHNKLSPSALESFLDSILRCKPPGRMKKPPLWVRLEHNGIKPSSLDVMMKRINKQGLKAVIVDKKDGAPAARSQIDADVQLYFAD